MTWKSRTLQQAGSGGVGGWGMPLAAWVGHATGAGAMPHTCYMQAGARHMRIPCAVPLVQPCGLQRAPTNLRRKAPRAPSLARSPANHPTHPSRGTKDERLHKAPHLSCSAQPGFPLTLASSPALLSPCPSGQ
jgi:hypothetical protein